MSATVAILAQAFQHAVPMSSDMRSVPEGQLGALEERSMPSGKHSGGAEDGQVVADVSLPKSRKRLFNKALPLTPGQTSHGRFFHWCTGASAETRIRRNNTIHQQRRKMTKNGFAGVICNSRRKKCSTGDQSQWRLYGKRHAALSDTVSAEMSSRLLQERS